MINTLFFIHIVIAVLLILVILLQRTNTDGLTGIGGGGINNMGLVSHASATSFLTTLTGILAAIFFINAIILANILSQPKNGISNQLLKQESSQQNQVQTPNSGASNAQKAVPIAK